MTAGSEIERRFAHHPPLNKATADAHDHVRGLAKAFAAAVDAELPPGREAALFMTHLEQAAMWAHAAIARGPS